MLGLEVSLLCFLEVDNTPDGVEVIWFDVLVLQVEGMLPNVNSNDGFMGEERILVGCGDNLEFLGGLAVPEPAPATALDSSGNGVHLLLERFDAAEVSDQSLLQGAVWELPAMLVGRRKILPKEGMIDVTPSVKLQRGLQRDELLGTGSLGEGSLCRVQTIHVGLVVFAMVKLHDLFRDVRFESVVGIWKFWERMLSPRKHGGSPVHRGAGEGASSGPRESRKQGHDG